MAAELEPVEQQIEQQLGVELCYRDTGVAAFGLHNALYAIGDKLLEVVSPTQEGTTAGRLLEKRGGDGGYMVILQTDDLDEMRRRFDEHDVRIVHVADGEGIRGIHLHPRDIGGAIVSVDQTTDWQAWGWAGPSWQQTVKDDVVTELVAVEVQADDPGAMAKRWSKVLGRPLAADSGGKRIDLDEGAIRFVKAADGRGDGVSAIDVRAANGTPRSEVVCGTTVNFIA